MEKEVYQAQWALDRELTPLRLGLASSLNQDENCFPAVLGEFALSFVKDLPGHKRAAITMILVSVHSNPTTIC